MLPKILSEMARPISYVNYSAPVSPILNEEQKAAFQKIDHEHEVVWVDKPRIIQPGYHWGGPPAAL